MDTKDPAAYVPVFAAFARIQAARTKLATADSSVPPIPLHPDEEQTWRDERVRAAQASLDAAEGEVFQIIEESGLSPDDWRWNMTALLEGTDVTLR